MARKSKIKFFEKLILALWKGDDMIVRGDFFNEEKLSFPSVFENIGSKFTLGRDILRVEGGRVKPGSGEIEYNFKLPEVDKAEVCTYLAPGSILSGGLPILKITLDYNGETFVVTPPNNSFVDVLEIRSLLKIALGDRVKFSFEHISHDDFCFIDKRPVVKI